MTLASSVQLRHPRSNTKTEALKNGKTDYDAHSGRRNCLPIFQEGGRSLSAAGGGCEGGGVSEAVEVVDGVGVGGEERIGDSGARAKRALSATRSTPHPWPSDLQLLSFSSVARITPTTKLIFCDSACSTTRSGEPKPTIARGQENMSVCVHATCLILTSP